MITFLQWLETLDNLTQTGKYFDPFSTQVTRGEFGRSNVPFKPVLNNDKYAHIDQEMSKHGGFFDDHISKSIPTFREVAVRKAHAIVKVFGKGASMIDLGGDEGALDKTVSAMSNGRIQSRVLDPNNAMKDFFNDKSQVPGSVYDNRAFISGWVDDNGAEIPGVHAGNHEHRYDIVHEAMTFQFMNNDRTRHVYEAKRLLKPSGVFITQEKLITPRDEWDRNEKLKDTRFKNVYYTNQELSDKQKVVGVSFNQQQPDATKVNMVDNMVTVEQFEGILKSTFRAVWQFWDAGNFKGYVASDDDRVASSLVSAMGDLNSEFSTVKTPRRV